MYVAWKNKAKWGPWVQLIRALVTHMDLITCMHLIHLWRTFAWVKSLAAWACVLHKTVILITLCKTVTQRRQGLCKIQQSLNQSVQSDGVSYNKVCFQKQNPLGLFSENAHPQGQRVRTGNHEMALQDQSSPQHPPSAMQRRKIPEWLNSALLWP